MAKQPCAIIGGAVVGYFVGALPGLSAGMGIALLLPFTFYFPAAHQPRAADVLYSAAEYGGSITAVLINVPGEAGAIPTCFDGYPLTQKGQPGKALGRLDRRLVLRGHREHARPHPGVHPAGPDRPQIRCRRSTSRSGSSA